MSEAKVKPAVNHAAITTDDTDLIGPCRALRILTAGNLHVSLVGDATTFITYAVTAGEIFPAEVAIMHTDSTCTAARWW